MNKKMQTYWAKHDQWIKERDEALLSPDINKYKAFYEKWRKEGVYDMPLRYCWYCGADMRKERRSENDV